MLVKYREKVTLLHGVTLKCVVVKYHYMTDIGHDTAFLLLTVILADHMKLY